MKYALPLCHRPRNGAWRSADHGDGGDAGEGSGEGRGDELIE
jgi:hypothetical protein